MSDQRDRPYLADGGSTRQTFPDAALVAIVLGILGSIAIARYYTAKGKGRPNT